MSDPKTPYGWQQAQKNGESQDFVDLVEKLGLEKFRSRNGG